MPAGKPPLQSRIARQYRDKYPDKSSHSLAKLMHEENKMHFRDKEAARIILRYIEGKAGSKLREHVKTTKYFKEEERSVTPYNIPVPDDTDLEPFILPKAFNHFILAGDFHVPNHRVEPIKAMLDYANEKGIRKLVLNGDLLDNTPFTRWLHEPIDLNDVPRWFDMGHNLLKEFKVHFDEIYWLEGNHDFWFKRWLMQNAPLVFKDKYFHLEQRLKLNELGVKFIDQRYLVKAGRLNIHHGHILFRGGGSYANGARMLYMKAKSNMICSHLHVESSHTEPDVDDKIVTTFVTGCMCTLRPEYQPFGGKACHGFAEIKVKDNRDFQVNNIRIYKGEIV